MFARARTRNSTRVQFLLACLILIPTFVLRVARAEDTSPSTPATLHPALFLVGDSIMKTGTGNGEHGPWGWGAEIIPLFDASRIHIYNEGHGGRSSRSYIDEGFWPKILAQLQPGDFVILQFGHNDSTNSQSYPDRVTLPGSGDETREIESPVTHKPEAIHTYGWYLRQYLVDIKSKGATAILCSPVPRNSWAGGKIKRGFDGYAQWAAEAARTNGAFFLDLNTLAANRFDALGQPAAEKCFADHQHTTKAGARMNAESVVAGLKQLPNCLLAKFLSPNSAPSSSAP